MGDLTQPHDFDKLVHATWSNLTKEDDVHTNDPTFIFYMLDILLHMGQQQGVSALQRLDLKVTTL